MKDLISILSRCAEHLGLISLVDGKQDPIEVWGGAKQPLREPAMYPDLTLGGVDLNDVSKHYYGSEVEEKHIFSAWERSVFHFHRANIRESIDSLTRCFPKVPFCRDDARKAMVQFVIASSWYHGRLKLTGAEATLKIGDREIGVDRRSLLSLSPRAAPHVISFEPRAYARQGIGRSRLSSSRVGAMRRHLMQTFPKLSAQADFLMSVALHGECESVLSAPFTFIWLNQEQRKEMEAWETAQDLIERSKKGHDPYLQIKVLLENLVPPGEFKHAFGIHSPKLGFSELRRRKYRRALCAIHPIYPDRINTPDPEDRATFERYNLIASAS